MTILLDDFSMVAIGGIFSLGAEQVVQTTAATSSNNNFFIGLEYK